MEMDIVGKTNMAVQEMGADADTGKNCSHNCLESLWLYEFDKIKVTFNPRTGTHL